MPKLRLLLLPVLLLLPACQQQMSSQPYYRPLEKSDFFRDGRSARPRIPGTVARGEMLPTSPLMTGLKPRSQSGGTDASRAAALVGQQGGLGALANLSGGAGGVAPEPGLEPSEYVDEFPFEITQQVLDRGRQRFLIYCAVCHDPTGNGHGKIVERGYTQPPSYITDYSRAFNIRGRKVLLRDVPVGYLFEVQTQGFGAMPDYSTQIDAHDRWAIAAYIRALQFSQHAKLGDLPEAERARARSALEGNKENGR